MVDFPMKILMVRTEDAEEFDEYYMEDDEMFTLLSHILK
jgi:hypothetical protein